MYFLLITRVVRVNVQALRQYDPRTANNKSYHLAGPFTSRKLAEQSSLAVLATHTCLGVKILEEGQLEEVLYKSDVRDVQILYRECVKLLAHPAVVS